MKHYFLRMKGNGTVSPPRKPMTKIVWSVLGAFLGILLIVVFERLRFALPEKLFLVGSFGASAVLIYGAPLAEFSQPRNLVGGHVFSAIIGITIVKLLGPDVLLAAPLAVSFAIFVMHLTRTLHPPGGATALIAVIGGTRIHSLGYGYVFFPILSGTIIMLAVALLVNNLSTNPKRHYPLYWI